MRKSLVIIAIIALLGMLSMPVFAQGAVAMKATITKMQGEVLVTKTGTASARQAAIGDVLGSGDQVETKENGEVAIKMDNGNIINLTPKSQIILSNLTSNPTTGEYENLMESNFGTIRANVAAKVKGKSAFRIKTPTAISGARGTVYYLVITEASTRVYVLDGSVDFSNPNTGDTFVVVAGTTSISEATGVSEPVELTGADRDAVIAAYGMNLAVDPVYPEPAGRSAGEGEVPYEQPVPDAPSQTDSPQTPTDVPAPGQLESPSTSPS